MMLLRKNDLTESINFPPDEFKEYEEDRAKKDKIIEYHKSEVDSLSTKVKKLEKLKCQYMTLQKRKKK